MKNFNFILIYLVLTYLLKMTLFFTLKHCSHIIGFILVDYVDVRYTYAIQTYRHNIIYCKVRRYIISTTSLAYLPINHFIKVIIKLQFLLLTFQTINDQ